MVRVLQVFGAEVTMAHIKTTLSLPELGLIAATRGFIGAGIGLLLAGRIRPEQRRAVGLTLLIVVDVHPDPLNQTSKLDASICALSILFMLVAEAFRVVET